jgi:hypothetical protein
MNLHVQKSPNLNIRRIDFLENHSEYIKNFVSRQVINQQPIQTSFLINLSKIYFKKPEQKLLCFD